jgi:hypothetical protein
MLFLTSLSLGRKWISAPFRDFCRGFSFLPSRLETASCCSLYSPTLRPAFINCFNFHLFWKAPRSRICSYLSPLDRACTMRRCNGGEGFLSPLNIPAATFESNDSYGIMQASTTWLSARAILLIAIGLSVSHVFWVIFRVPFVFLKSKPFITGFCYPEFLDNTSLSPRTAQSSLSN